MLDIDLPKGFLKTIPGNTLGAYIYPVPADVIECYALPGEENKVKFIPLQELTSEEPSAFVNLKFFHPFPFSNVLVANLCLGSPILGLLLAGVDAEIPEEWRDYKEIYLSFLGNIPTIVRNPELGRIVIPFTKFVNHWKS